MAWRHLVEQSGYSARQIIASRATSGLVFRLQASLSQYCFNTVNVVKEGSVLQGGQKRMLSGYIGNLARRVKQLEKDLSQNANEKEVALLKELNKMDPEGVIKWYESRPQSWYNPQVLAEYLRALVKVDRLNESELLETLQKGVYARVKGGTAEHDNALAASLPVAFGVTSPLRSVGTMTKDGILGSAS
eukprot:c29184_g2_i1 orf=540-1106(+)